jgi:hypothetical protein
MKILQQNHPMQENNLPGQPIPRNLYQGLQFIEQAMAQEDEMTV